ncbi:MAG TPA: tetratricopeptide repeat protein [Acetobacteraceae bacterium]|nr:tetratricopeptide repeat protein [Acetobacteraceae bacterium]
MSEALRHHEAGRLGEAQALYRHILEQDPDHADSLHLLGLVTTAQGDPEAGAALIRRAVAIAPGRAPYHNNLALSYRLLGRNEDAVCEYRTAVTLRPQSAEIHNNLATTLRDLGRHEEAVAHYRQAAEHAPRIAAVWYNLANALGERGAPAEADACFRRAVALQPDFTNAHANYGRWLMTQVRWPEAESRLAEAARLDPGQAPTWSNLGIALQEQGRSQEAEACYRRALVLAPHFAMAHCNLGCLLLEQGRTDDAAACQQAAIAADPDYGAARLALCMAQLPILYRTEAEIAERRRRYTAALDSLARALEAPAAMRSLATAIGTAQPFFLPYQGENDRALQATYGRLACRVLEATEPPAPLAPRPAAGQRIRLGIVSGFFCQHTIFKLFLEGWLTQLDRSRFEVIGFHTGRTADGQTARAARWCDRFVQGFRPPAAWREAVSATAPHVLLYPEVGMDPLAARLAAQRLAPVQCVAWGQPETTGMPTLDYFLSSDMMEPPDAEAHYNEQLVRLPHLGLCYLPDEPSAVRLNRAALGLHPTAPVYWSGQALYKYRPAYDAVFPRIAAAVGACQFVFIGFAKSRAVTAAFRERLGVAFAAFGLDAERYCVTLPPMSPERFVAAVGVADVVLDTPGWSGGKSTLDCLAQDPAIVTLPGCFMRGRHTHAILRRIGCEATIAGSLEDYVAIAARLGRDVGWRTQVRQAVARGKARAFRDLEYVRALETFLVEAVASPATPGAEPRSGSTP